jgi:hypothetical protein
MKHVITELQATLTAKRMDFTHFTAQQVYSNAVKSASDNKRSSVKSRLFALLTGNSD